jgi:hypothetical protein
MSPDSLELLDISEREAYATLLNRFFKEEENGDIEHFQQFMKLKLILLDISRHIQIVKEYREYAETDPEGFLENEAGSYPLRKGECTTPIETVTHPFSIGFVLSNEDYHKCFSDGSGGVALVNNDLNHDLDSTIYLYGRSTYEYDPKHEPLHLIYSLFSRSRLFGDNSPIKLDEPTFNNPSEIALFDNFKQLVGQHLFSVQTECISYVASNINRYNMYGELYKGTIERLQSIPERLPSVRNPDQNEFGNFLGEQIKNIKIFCEEYLNTIKKLTDYFSDLRISHDLLIGMLLSTPMDKVHKIVEYVYWYAENKLNLPKEEVKQYLELPKDLRDYLKIELAKMILIKTEFSRKIQSISGMDEKKAKRFAELPQFNAWIREASSSNSNRLSPSLIIAAEYYAKNEHLVENAEITTEMVAQWMSERLQEHAPCYHLALYIFGRLACTEFRDVSIDVVGPYLKKKLIEENPNFAEKVDMDNDYLDLINELVEYTIADPHTSYEDLWTVNFYTPPSDFIDKADENIPQSYLQWEDFLTEKGYYLPLIQDLDTCIKCYVNDEKDRMYSEIPPIKNMDMRGFEELDPEHVKGKIWEMTGAMNDDVVWNYTEVSLRELFLKMSVEELDASGRKLSDAGIETGHTLAEDFDIIYYHRTGKTFFMNTKDFEGSEAADYYKDTPFGRYSYLSRRLL